MYDTLSAAQFTPHVGKNFQPRGWQGTLELISVDSKPNWGGRTEPPFNLLFRGPRNDVLQEGYYAFDVADGPAFEFYIMPIATSALSHQDYQAVFN